MLRYGLPNNINVSWMAVWIFKLVLLEPLRWIEAFVMVLLPEKEVQPVFILGYYRSGTTYLQELLSQDKNRATLTLFQSVLPEVCLCFGWLFVPLFSVVTRLLNTKNPFHRIDFDWTFPGEEDVALNALMAPLDYNRLYQFPFHHQGITEDCLYGLENDHTCRKWMDSYGYLIKKLFYCTRKYELVLKSPPNMARLNHLKSRFPSASFIFIHRDPEACISSARRLWKLNRSFSFQRYSEEKVREILLHQFKTFYELFEADGGFENCIEIRFEKLISDASLELERLYKTLMWEGWTAVRPQVLLLEQVRRQKNPTPLTVDAYLREDKFIRSMRKKLGY